MMDEPEGQRHNAQQPVKGASTRFRQPEAHSSTFHEVPLTERRNALLQLRELQYWIAEFDFDENMNAILPSLKPGVDNGDVLDELKSDGHVVDGRWSCFPLESKS